MVDQIKKATIKTKCIWIFMMKENAVYSYLPTEIRLAEKSQRLDQKHHVIDGEVYTRREIHRFHMGDVEDPELYAAGPLWDWQQTPMGQWVMKHCKDPTFQGYVDVVTYGYNIVIVAHMTDKRYTEFALKFL
jgi:hypothetical protein